MDKVGLRVRDAMEVDIPALMDLARQLAVYERSPESFVATEDDYTRFGFGPDAVYRALLAENTSPGSPRFLGLALYYFTFSTWTGRPTLWLEDIFVPEELRGSGVGSMLLGRLAKIAFDKGCARMEWNVLDWNEPSRKFYYGLGAKSMDEWTTFRLKSAELKKLAKE